MSSVNNDISILLSFLPCATPAAWLDWALTQLDLLLIDHAHCEKKAASTALTMIYRYPDKARLVKKMSPLAREELLHFEKVLGLLEQRNLEFRLLTPCRYAGQLHKLASNHEPQRVVDLLIIGAFIEARSCERFYRLVPHLDDELASFYHSLVKAEARHFEEYLTLAHEYAIDSLQPHIEKFAAAEQELILSSDDTFRFHSGIPIVTAPPPRIPAA